MKLTAVQLRSIIKEEVTNALGEAKMPDMKEKLASVFEEFGLDVSPDTLEQIMDLAQSETDPDLESSFTMPDPSEKVRDDIKKRGMFGR